MMLVAPLAIFSCSDDDNIDASSDRLMRPQFRTRYTVSSGTSDPYLCEVRNTNRVFLAWSKVNDAVKYEIRMGTQQKVSGGAEAWENPDNLVLDTLLDADRDTLLLRDLSYATNYRFAIRAIAADPSHNSEWWGYGDGQHWADYLGLTTEARYSTPNILYQKSDLTKTGVNVYLNRLVDYDNDNFSEWKEHFTITQTASGKDVWKIDYLTLAASPSNPDVTVPTQYVKVPVSDIQWDGDTMAVYHIEGLDSNSVYTVDVVDADIPVKVDGIYNTLSFRTKGTPGAPITVPANPQDTMIIDGQTIQFANGLKATMLTDVLDGFMTDNSLAEGQTFYLEGGQAYVFRGNQDLYKGFILKTNPEDLAAGKGRAKVYLGGVSLNGNATRTMNFMLGRMPVDGENANIPIDIDSLVFEEIDFDVPLAQNKFENSASGNYFCNQYSGGMGINVNSFVVRNCSFQHIIRGFFRTQCAFGEYIDKFLIEGNEFYNCGGYSGNGSGYNFINGDMNNAASNIFHNLIWRNNTIYDCPMGNLITHGTKTGAWTDPDLVFNITIENNTFVNWNTYSGRPLISMRSIPAGSTFTIKKNLFVQTKAADDDRAMNLSGADIRTLNGANSGKTTFDISNNWSTSDNINASSGDVFTASAFSATKNSFGAWANQYNNDPEGCDVQYPSGTAALKVTAAEISAVDLMNNPNPPHKVSGTEDADDHYVDDLEGNGSASVNLYFKNMDNEIVKNGIGAPKWRTSK